MRLNIPVAVNQPGSAEQEPISQFSVAESLAAEFNCYSRFRLTCCERWNERVNDIKTILFFDIDIRELEGIGIRRPVENDTDWIVVTDYDLRERDFSFLKLFEGLFYWV